MFKRLFSFILVLVLVFTCIAFAQADGSGKTQARSATINLTVNKMIIENNGTLTITPALSNNTVALQVDLDEASTAAGITLAWDVMCNDTPVLNTGSSLKITVEQIKAAQQSSGVCTVTIKGYRQVRNEDSGDIVGDYYAFKAGSDTRTDADPLVIKINVVYAGEIIEDPTEDDAKEDGKTGDDDDDATKGEFTITIAGTDMMDGDRIMDHITEADIYISDAIKAMLPEDPEGGALSVRTKLYYMSVNGDDAKGKVLTEDCYAKYEDGGYYIWAVATLTIPVAVNTIEIDE